jgi:GNAT superfamily N-acetyltransferase
VDCITNTGGGRHEADRTNKWKTQAPKVSIGVKPNARGQGVGEKLMRALIGEAARRGLGLCLSVRSENPARRLYERLGFCDIAGSAATNRAGGMSIGMALRR